MGDDTINLHESDVVSEVTQKQRHSYSKILLLFFLKELEIAM